MPAKSKRQAAYFGAVIAGRARGKGHPSKAQARELLRGTKVKRLPRTKRKRKRK